MKEEKSLTGNFILFFGLLGLFHSFYSTLQHLSYIKAIQRAEDHLPLDIVLECLFSSIVCMVGIALVSQSFKNISLEAAAPLVTIASVDNSPSFMIFQHRAKYLTVDKDV